MKETLSIFKNKKKKTGIILAFAAMSSFAYGQISSITSFTPSSGTVGTNVTITGTGFDTTSSNNVVFLGGVKCNIVNATATELVITIPNGVTTGKFNYTNKASNKVCIAPKSFGIKFNNGASNTYVSGNYKTAQIKSINTASIGSGDIFSLADFNDDKKIDVVVFEIGGTNRQMLNVYVNNSNSGSTFAASDITKTNYVDINTGKWGDPGNIKVADFNGDGLLDAWGGMQGNDPLAISFKNTSTSSSAISFANQGFIGSFACYGAAISDYNLDGKLDIFTGYPLSGYDLETYTNSTSSTSGNLSFTITGPSGAFNGTNSGTNIGLTADLNNDGYTDHVAAGGNYLNIRKNSSGGTFTALSSINCGIGSINTIKAYDFDGDGLEELIVSGNNASLKLYKNSSTSSALNFSTSSSITTNNNSNYGIALADFNSDGKMDILVSGDNGIDLLLNESTGTGVFSFSKRKISIINDSKQLKDLFSVDFNNDGNLDIIGINSSQLIYIPYETSNLSIVEVAKGKANLYPNPTTGLVTIDLPVVAKKVKVQVYNTVGQLVDTIDFQNIKKQDYVINTPAGVYNVVVTADENKQSFKVIKK